VQRSTINQKYTEAELEEAHRATALDEMTIAKSTLFGCFYCCKTFPPSTVKAYIDGPSHKWAHCPKCGIDAVISDDGAGLIDEQLLVEMKAHYF
jgi:hypothetical protein